MRYLIGFALLLPMVVFAQYQGSNPRLYDPHRFNVPLPEALLNAKTAFVEKAGITAEIEFDKFCKAPKVNAGAIDKSSDEYCKALEKDVKANKKLFDKFCKELKKWGRFTLVQDRSSADVRIYLQRTWTNTGYIKVINNIYDLIPPVPGETPSWKVEETTINIMDGRNDVYLYADQTNWQRNDPGNLVSELKKMMKRK
jgi:hypothetical protein